MKSEKKHHRARSPVGAGRRGKASEEAFQEASHLAALTRANHDLRSPLSVILGVFELLGETGGLRPGERRYVELGGEAAAELQSQADALRLYSAIARNLVSLESVPVDVTALIRERLLPPLAKRQVTLATQFAGGLTVVADPGYLGVALAGLAKHLAAHLPEAGADGPLALEVLVAPGESDSVSITVHDLRSPEAPPEFESLSPGAVDLTAVNAAGLIARMNGRVDISARHAFLQVALPAAAQA